MFSNAPSGLKWGIKIWHLKIEQGQRLFSAERGSVRKLTSTALSFYLHSGYFDSACITEALGHWSKSSSLSPAQPCVPLGANTQVGGERPRLHLALLWKCPPAAAAASACLHRRCSVTDNSLQQPSSLSNHVSKIITDWFGVFWCHRRVEEISGLDTMNLNKCHPLFYCPAPPGYFKLPVLMFPSSTSAALWLNVSDMKSLCDDSALDKIFCTGKEQKFPGADCWC